MGKPHLRIIDYLILATLALFSLLAVLFFHRMESWWLLVLKNIAVAVAYIAINSYGQRIKKSFGKFFLRMTAVTLTYAVLFGAVEKLQLIFHGHWMDDLVIRFEHAIFGLQPTIWLQQFISKPLTEWMMFAYVFYMLMYPVLCAIIYFQRDEQVTENYLLTLGISNIICDFCFIFFPVVGPLYYMGSHYVIPLDGYIWTWFGELLRQYVQYPGGSLPSPHCANATVMWLMAYRYHRPSFWILAPIVLSLYVSTFYGRYHYLSDAVFGIATGFLAYAIAAKIEKNYYKSLDK